MSTSIMLMAAPTRADSPTRIDTYQLDTVHSRVLFEVTHAGLSQSLGTLRIASGRLQWDAQRAQEAALQVDIDLRSLDMGDADWNRKLSAKPYFDVERHPQASFIARRFIPGAATGRWQVEGELTLNGLTRPVALQARINDERRHPLTFKRTLGVSATATLSRADFGMDAWPKLIGEQVMLRIESEWIYDGREQTASPSKDGP